MQNVRLESLIPPDLAAIEIDNFNGFKSSYPQDLLARYSDETLTFRARLHGWTKSLLLERKQYEQSAGDKIGWALLSPNLLLPQRIRELNHVFDFIGSTFVVSNQISQTAVTIMEDSTYGRISGVIGHNERGMGKTAFSLAVLGIPNFLGKLPEFTPDKLIDLEAFTPLVLIPKEKNEDIAILSLDLTYAGISGGNLVVSPIMGAEGFDGQSDIARYTARAKVAAKNQVYDRRNPTMSRYYTNCAKRTFLDSSQFIPKNSLVPLTKLVAVHYVANQEQRVKQLAQFQLKTPTHLYMITDETGPWVALDIEKGDKAQNTVVLLFSHNPLYHPSPTWSGIDKDLHVRTIREVSDKLPAEVAHLYVFPGLDGYSPQTAAMIFAEGAQFIRQWMTDGL